MLYLFCFKKKYIHRNKITTKSIAVIKAPRNPEFSNTSPRIFTTAQSPKHQPITLRWFVPCAESTNHLKPRLGYGHRHLLPKNVRREILHRANLFTQKLLHGETFILHKYLLYRENFTQSQHSHRETFRHSQLWHTYFFTQRICYTDFFYTKHLFAQRSL